MCANQQIIISLLNKQIVNRYPWKILIKHLPAQTAVYTHKQSVIRSYI